MTKSSDRSDKGRPPLRDLSSHPEPFVSTDDLAKYWAVSRRQIYKQIENGSLPAIRMGPRSVRIPTREAAEFEKRSMLAAPPAAAPPRDEQHSREERWGKGSRGESEHGRGED